MGFQELGIAVFRPPKVLFPSNTHNHSMHDCRSRLICELRTCDALQLHSLIAFRKLLAKGSFVNCLEDQVFGGQC
jgi:hypothetical protein